MEEGGIADSLRARSWQVKPNIFFPFLLLGIHHTSYIYGWVFLFCSYVVFFFLCFITVLIFLLSGQLTDNRSYHTMKCSPKFKWCEDTRIVFGFLRFPTLGCPSLSLVRHFVGGSVTCPVRGASAALCF